MRKRFLATVLACGLGATAHAAPEVPLSEQPLYWGLGYSWVTYSEDAWISGEASAGAITGRFGYKYSDTISAEARYVQGVRAGDVTDPDLGEVDVEVDGMYGLYGKFNLLTDVDFSPYAILGVAQGEVTGSNATGSSSQSEMDFSYGVGVDLCRDQPVCLNVEYTSYLNKDNFQAEAYSVGLKARF